MSTTPSQNSQPAALPPATESWRHSWANFWFKPKDPTTFGFMRICTGLLVLYIHLAYSVDLQAFFGKHGWYASAFIERERHETPSFVTPFFDWDDPFVFARLSDFPHRRAAFMQFLRALPADRAERAVALAYLSRANRLSNDDDFRRALDYVQRMGTRAEREDYIKAMLGEKIEVTTPLTGGDPKKIDLTSRFKRGLPAIFSVMPTDEKTRLASEIRAFWEVFSSVKWADTERGRDFVFNYFIELPRQSRTKLVEFTESLGNETAAEQKRLLDYFEYWNNDPRTTFRQGNAIFSVWFHVTDPTQMALVHAGILVLIVMFTIGLFSRVTSVLVWLAVLSYIHRTQQVLFGMDTMMNILLFYLMIGNCGAALSVDRLIARYRATRASLARSGTLDLHTRTFLAYPPPSVSCGFAMRLLQVHFCFIYMAAGLSKLKGDMWWTGQAFWEVVVNPEFSLLPYAFYEGGLRILASAKPVYHFMIWSGVWFTLFVEIGLPFLVWTRLRWLIILLAVVMHAIIAVLMGLNLFELLMLVMLLSFLPDRVIRDRFRGGPDLSKFTFAFNPAIAMHARAAALALALDIDNQVTLAPDATVTEPTVTVAGGKPLANSEGANTLLRGLRLSSVMSLVLWIPGVKGLLSRRLFPTYSAQTDVAMKPPTPAAR